MGNFFVAQNLCYAYIKKPLCLKDVCFSVERNEKVLVLGKKDSGKTTLLKILSGFDDKYFGFIKINGNEIKSMNDTEKQVSLIFDYPILLKGSIKKNIEYVFKVLDKQIISESEILNLLKTFGLNHELKLNIKKLSVFEKFKLCLLRTYLKQPKIIFIDSILSNNFNLSELDELKNILDMICYNKLVFLCASEEEFLNYSQFYEWFNADRIFYLNLAKLTEYKSINGFLSNPFDLDACAFNNGLNEVEGYCVKQNGRYYLSIEEKYVLKIDIKFNSYFDKLKLADGENEDVVIVYKKNEKVDFSKNNDFNKLLLNKQIKVFSRLDRSRVI